MSFLLKLFGGASVETASGPLTGRAVQRRRLALLALLALARSRGFSRDKLIAYLWPESDAERGRHLLSDSVYRINQALGGSAISGAGDELRLSPQVLPSDVGEFEEALERGEWERAVDIYAGPFLDGFYVPEAANFERWMEGERERLAGEYTRALESLAKEAEAAGDRSRAVEWWRRLAAHDPYNSRAALHLMEALEAAGERARALQHFRVLETLLREEFGTEPDPRILAMAERLRQETPVSKPAPEEGTMSDREGEAETFPAPQVPTAPPELPAPGSRPPIETLRHAARRWRRPRRRSMVTALFCVALIAGAWAVSRSYSRAAAPAPTPTIAVLPFLDMSPGKDQEYFSDGITEELINTLMQVEGLRVAARTSVFGYKDKNVDVREVGETLGVATVLEGSIRKSGSKLRITAQLVSTDDGYHLWSEAYEREMEDVFAIQEEISRAIVTILKGKLVDRGDIALAESSTDDPEAYNLYLQGRYFWHTRTEEGLRKAAEYFGRAVERAPDYARAYVGLADAYAVLGFYDYLPPREAFPRANAAAKRALELDGSLAAAHATLGYVALYYEWNAAAAEAEFQRSIALDPSYSKAHQWYANLLTAMGRFDQAAREMRQAQELDPLSLVANAALGWVLYYAGQYERAIEQCGRTLELDSSFELAYLWSGLALEQLGRMDEAREMLEHANTLSRGSAISLAALARTHALSGRRNEAVSLLEQLENRGQKGYVPPFEVAKVYVALGERGKGIEWLEKAYEQRSHSMVFLKVDPQLAVLRLDPHFAQLVKKVGW
ncbi:MAG: BTAD domain-containing putative transcriptional regulator [Longimicrobiaceae bacterium]